MTSSGLSLLRSLAILEEQTSKPTLAKAIREVRRDIEAGNSLSASMAKQDRIFPQLMVAMISAGETGGFLDSALDRIAINFEKDANLRAKIKSAMTYPVIVLVFAFLMISGVLLFIVPIFEKMFRQLGGKLPLPTRIMVAISHQMVWLVAAGARRSTIGGTILFRRKLREDYAWRLGFDRFKLRVPVFGPLFTKIAISRFARNFGTLLSVGVPVMQALDVVAGTTGNAVIGEAMKDVQNSVRDGQPMSAPLRPAPDLPADGDADDGGRRGDRSDQRDARQGRRLLRPRGGDRRRVAHRRDRAGDGGRSWARIIGTMVICLYLPMFTIYQHIQGAQ